VVVPRKLRRPAVTAWAAIKGAPVKPQKKIHIPKKNEGKLHREMGKKPGQKLSREELQKELAHAKATHNVTLEHEVLFALNFGHKK